MRLFEGLISCMEVLENASYVSAGLYWQWRVVGARTNFGLFITLLAGVDDSTPIIELCIGGYYEEQVDV